MAAQYASALKTFIRAHMTPRPELTAAAITSSTDRGAFSSAFEIDVANLQFVLPAGICGVTLQSVKLAVEDLDYADPVAVIRLLVRRRYGLRGDIAEVQRKVTLLEAGFVTGRGWWGVPQALSDASTNFHKLEVQLRMELIVCELLQCPEIRPTSEWSSLYGYSSATALSRALRTHFGLGIGDVRRMGLLGQWLALRVRAPRTGRGIARERQARSRLACFQTHMAARDPGPDAMHVIEQLGTFVPRGPEMTRPRYPAVAAQERALALNRT